MTACRMQLTIVLTCLFIVSTVFFSGCSNQTDKIENPASGRFADETNIVEVEIITWDGDTFIKEIDLDGLELDPIEPPQVYGFKNERQSRFDAISQIQNYLHIALSAYYREHRTIPDTLEDLAKSDWYWFEPVETQYIPGLQIVDGQPGAPRDDLNTIQCSFTDIGMEINAYHYYNYPENPEEFVVVKFGKEDFIGDEERYFLEFPAGSKYIDSDPLNIRITYIQHFCDRALADYWSLYLEFPQSFNEMLDDGWKVRDGIPGNLSAIPAGEPGAFYFGINVDKSISYFEYTLNGNGSVVVQKVYEKEDPAKILSGDAISIGRYVCHGEEITRDSTIPIVDSSVRNWGLVNQEE